MKEKFYLAVIVVLTALSMFLFMAHRRDCRLLQPGGPECAMEGGQPGHGPGRGGGMGRGMGMGMGPEGQAARSAIFQLIKSGSSDTALIYSQLDGLVEVQRENQKAVLRRLLSLRDSLTGNEREAFLRKLDERFCQPQGGRGQGRGMGRD